MSFLRQTEFFDPENIKASVTLIGVGSVGSFLALSLSKMGIERMVLYDPDLIEEHNISNQFFRTISLGNYKVSEIQSAMLMYGLSKDIEAHQEIFDETKEISTEIVISSVDSMEARRKIWEALRNKQILYIDTRMAGEYFRIYSLRADNEESIKKYEETLIHPDVEAPCGARTIIYNVLQISSLASLFVKKYYKGEEIPFFYSQDTNNLYHYLEA